LNQTTSNYIPKAEEIKLPPRINSSPETSGLVKLLLEILENQPAKYTYKVFETLPFENAGEDIKNHLGNSKQVILLAATLGVEIDREIRRLELISINKAYLLNEIACETIEAVCDYACAEMKKVLKKTYNGVHTTRFSPGYGDFPLSLQPEFLKLLSAEKNLGVTADKESFLLSPRKTVTAVVGIS